MSKLRTLALAFTAVIACALAACSSSGTTSSPRSGGGATGSGGDSAAERALAAYTREPSSIPSAPALAGAVPAGKSFVYISNGSNYDKILTKGLQAATKEVHWNFRVIQDSLSDPSTAISALTTAVNAGATAVMISSTPQTVWQSVIPQAKAKGTLIISYHAAEAPDQQTSGVYQLQNGITFSGLAAKQVMAAIAVDAGKSLPGTHVMGTEVPQLGAAQTTWSSTLKSDLTAQCGSCSFATQQVSVADIFAGKSTGQVVSYLQRNPDTKYVAMSPGQTAVGLSQAIRAASLPSPKIAGVLPTPDQLSDLTSGASLAWVVEPQQMESWEAVDVAIRHALNQSLFSWPFVLRLITKSNLGQITDTSDPEFPQNYSAQFAKLWKVSQ